MFASGVFGVCQLSHQRSRGTQQADTGEVGALLNRPTTGAELLTTYSSSPNYQ